MAQKRKRNRSKKWVSWLILLILAVVAGVIVYLVWDNYFNVEKDNNKSQETTQTGETQNEKKVASEGNEEVTGKERVEQYDGEDPNKAETLSGVVTYAGVSGDKLMIRVNIDQYLEGGECGLTLSRAGASIYSSIANVVGNASTATCEGFDVPINELGGGVTEINININSGERSGTIRGEVNI